MKITSLKEERNNQYTNFKSSGALVTQGLHYLNTYPAVGALFIDAGSMGVPRTLVDSTRGLDAAKETAIREFGSTLNFTLLGIWGIAATTLFGWGFNKSFNGVRADKIFANGETVDVMSELYNNAKISDKYTTKASAFANEFCENFTALNNNKWVGITDENAKSKVAKLLTDVISDNKNNYTKQDIAPEVKQKLVSLITSETGGNLNCKLKSNCVTVDANGKQVIKNVELSLNSILDSFVAVGRSFVKVGKDVVPDNLVNGLKNNKRISSLAGLAIPIAIAVSMQPINRWLTKLRTGKEGFVGVQGEQADSSSGLKVKKAVAAAAVGAACMSTIGPWSKIIDKIQFSGLVPNISQFKFIYSLTIASRILSARDGNELRETCIKDPLGFANWLIIGGFVSKLVANSYSTADKNLINYDNTLPADTGKLRRAWDWITKASVKSSEEILLADMKKAGISVMDGDNVKSFKQLLKELPEHMKDTRMKISSVNKAQIAGYVYSTVALGLGIPLLNIFITNKLHKKKVAKSDVNQKNVIGPDAANTKLLNPYFMADSTVHKIQSNNV